MRNFYLTADIDGRKTQLTGGPASKNGGMTIEIRQREDGSSVVAFKIRCYEHDGSLETVIEDASGHIVARFGSHR